MVLARLHCLHHNPANPAIRLLQQELDVPGVNIIHCIPYHRNYTSVSTADFDGNIHVHYTRKNPTLLLIFFNQFVTQHLSTYRTLGRDSHVKEISSVHVSTFICAWLLKSDSFIVAVPLLQADSTTDIYEFGRH